MDRLWRTFNVYRLPWPSIFLATLEKMSSVNYEMVLTVAVLALAAAIASDTIQLPFLAAAGQTATILLVIASLGAFSVYPAVGLSLFLLTAVLFFKRNVNATLGSSKAVYAVNSIMEQPHVPAAPFSNEASMPREYSQFEETNPDNAMHGPVTEGFEPAPFGAESGSPVEGQYPTDEERAISAPTPLSYVYRPEPETGSNEFVREGPNLDEKNTSIAYSE